MPYISFCCLIDLARALITILNKCGESGHLCLVPDLRGKVFNLSQLSIMLAVGLSYMAFTTLSYISSMSNL